MQLRYYYLLIIVVFTVTLTGYINVTGSYFLSDDFGHLSHARISPLEYFTTTWSGHTGKPGFYRPFIIQLFAVEIKLWGLNPVPYHLLNELVHAANSVFLALIIFEILKPTKVTKGTVFYVALASGIAFAVLARHTEAVSWISGRTDVISSFFFLLAVWFFFKSLSNTSKVSNLIWLVVPCYALGLISKESAIPLPLVLFLIWTFYYKGEKTGKNRNAVFASLCLTVTVFLIYIGVRYTIMRSPFAVKYVDWSGTEDTLYFVKNIIKLVLFTPGAPLRITQIAGLGVPLDGIIYIYLIVAALSGIIYRLRKRFTDKPAYREIIGALSIYLTATIPVIFAAPSPFSTASERFIYLPSAFFVAATVLLYFTIWKRHAVWVIVAWATLNLPLLIVINENWRNAGKLSKDLIEEYAELAPKGKVLILNVPDSLSLSYVFRNGFTGAVELTTNVSLTKAPVFYTISEKEPVAVKWVKKDGALIGSTDPSGWFRTFETTSGGKATVLISNNKGFPTTVRFIPEVEYDTIVYSSENSFYILE